MLEFNGGDEESECSIVSGRDKESNRNIQRKDDLHAMHFRGN